MKFRAFSYRRNFLKSYQLPVPVISVGNLTMGGSGKTPIVSYLARMLMEKGYKPAVISRGYKGSSKLPVTVVSDGDKVLQAPSLSGDEPFLIASTVPGIVVATGKRRILPCQAAVTDFKCDIIILDDGFQHLAVQRDIDLVLFDADFFAGNSRVFPGGDLREPVSALNRCDAFVITGVNRTNSDRAQKCTTVLEQKFPTKPIFTSRTYYKNATRYLHDHHLQETSVDLTDIPDNLIAFCGIANPDRFQRLLAAHSLVFAGFRSFPDHCVYSEEDIHLLINEAELHKSAGFLTTEKDFVKLKSLLPHRYPVYTLPLVTEPDSRLDDFILSKLR